MSAAQGFRFLYREDRGRISRATWWRAVLPLFAVVAVTTAGWVALRPFAVHDLATEPFLDAAVFGAYLYLALYAFVLILSGVCWYNLSAKRFRDRGRPGRLAAGLPLACFLYGALVWFAPRSFETVPDWATSLALVGVIVVLMLSIVDLGFGRTAVQSTRVVP